MNIDELSCHPVITSANQVDELTSPLKKFGITYFSLSIIDHEASLSGFCNNSKFIKEYLANKYYNIDLFKNLEEQINHNKTHTYVLWDNIKGNKTFDEFYREVHQHNVSHGFTIVENHANCQYIFTFGSTTNNHAINEFYYNNLDILHAFIAYFKSVIYQDKSLKQVLNAKFKLEFANDYQVLDPSMMDQLQVKVFDNNFLRINKFLLNTIDNRSSLTKHELACLYWLRQGKTVSEISELVFRSRRTIEEHVANIKRKMHCRTLLQVGEKIAVLGLSTILDNWG